MQGAIALGRGSYKWIHEEFQYKKPSEYRTRNLSHLKPGDNSSCVDLARLSTNPVVSLTTKLVAYDFNEYEEPSMKQ